MIVGTKAIPLDKLARECYSVSALNAFSLSMVPRYAQHITEIVDNQKYIIAMEVRALTTLSYQKKKELSEGLLEGVIIRGTINTIVDVEDLFSFINMSHLFKVLFKEELDSLN